MILPMELVVAIFWMIPESIENIHRLARLTSRRLWDHFSYIPRPPRLVMIPSSDRELNLKVDILEETMKVLWRKQLHYYPVCECCGNHDADNWPIEAFVGRYHFRALCGTCECRLRKEVRRYHPVVTSFKHISRDSPWWHEYSDRCRKYILWEKE